MGCCCCPVRASACRVPQLTKRPCPLAALVAACVRSIKIKAPQITHGGGLLAGVAITPSNMLGHGRRSAR